LWQKLQHCCTTIARARLHARWIRGIGGGTRPRQLGDELGDAAQVGVAQALCHLVDGLDHAQLRSRNTKRWMVR
jgi:hypothetical protein